MSGGAIAGGALLAVLLVTVPSDDKPEDAGYITDCLGGAAVNVRPDTVANRRTAAEWCSWDGHHLYSLWGQ